VSNDLFKSYGTLEYSVLPQVRLVANIDPEIAAYYRALIPKYVSFAKPLYVPHVSVIRKEIPTVLDAWGKYEGERVELFYDPYIFFGKVYCWLRVFSPRFEDIREELGLTRHSNITRPPDEQPCFHSTIANFKHLLEKKP
jgi:hypothetical protein